MFKLYQGGFLSATSVGFRPERFAQNAERGGVDFIEQELLEFSAVPVPANPDALVAAAAKGIDVTPVRRWFRADEIVLDLDDEIVLDTDFSYTPTVRSRHVDSIAFDGHPAELAEAIGATLPGLLAEARRERDAVIARAVQDAIHRARGRVD